MFARAFVIVCALATSAVAQSSGPVAAYSLVPTDAVDNPLAGPIPVGSTFFIDVLVQDLRDPAIPDRGIAAGNVDITYNEQGGGSLGTVPTGVILPDSAFYPSPTAAPHGDVTSTPGLLHFIQGAEALNPQGGNFYYLPLGGSAFVLDRIEMVATAPGEVLFSSQISPGDYAIVASGSGFGGGLDPAEVPSSQIQLGTAVVTVVPEPSTLGLAAASLGALVLMAFWYRR